MADRSPIAQGRAAAAPGAAVALAKEAPGALLRVEAEAGFDAVAAGDAVLPEPLGEDDDGPRSQAPTFVRPWAGSRSRRRERIGGGEDAAFGADQSAERGRSAGGPEERIADEGAAAGALGFEGH